MISHVQILIGPESVNESRKDEGYRRDMRRARFGRERMQCKLQKGSRSRRCAKDEGIAEGD